jgi:ribulose-bisphosphate carboxylase small chain
MTTTRITQGTFGSLPDLTDEEIEAQLRYATGNGWAVAIELTDDPDPRNSLWEMWCLPLFDLADPAPAMAEVRSCRTAFPSSYVKVTCFDAARGKETIGLSFLVQRPAVEQGFCLDRQHGPGRTSRFTLHARSCGQPRGTDG